MKLFTIAAAGLALITGLAPAAPAVAQPQRHVEHRVVTHTVRYDDRRYRPRVRTRTVCRREFRHGHSQRVCRTVRTRR